MKRKILCLIAIILMCLNGKAVNGSKLFDDTFLHEIRFENVDTNSFITTKNYQQLKMTVDGVAVDSIGFKRTGNISGYSNPNKLGVKVKTNKFVNGKNYDGIKEFLLHMNYQDPTMLREKLTYDICAQMGLYSLRTAFAKVYINNKYWGLYTIVEETDEMFKHVFMKRDLDAIESLDFGDMCFINNNPGSYDEASNGGSPTYKLDNGNAATAWERFAKMIDKANNTTTAYMDTVSKYLNLKDFFTYQAVNVYLMNFDSYIAFRGNQVYAYDTIQKFWQVIPWDFNASFGLWNTNNFQPNSYPILPNAIKSGCIASKLNSLNTLRTYYLDAMCKLNSILGDTSVYFGKINTFKNQIKQAVYDDGRKHISNSDFDKGTEYGYLSLFGENIPALKTFIKERINVIKQGLASENYTCNFVSIAEIPESDNLVGIFPNPAHTEIRFNFIGNDNQKHTKLIIYNSLGQEIYSSQQITQTISISHFANGVYSLVLQNDNCSKTYKFIKE